VKQNIKIYALR